MAAICHDAVSRWDGRVLILAHVRELLEQTEDKLNRFGLSKFVGVYSAGLRRRDKGAQILVAGIQSIYERAGELGPFDLILVDECFPAGTLITTPNGNVPIETIQSGQCVINAFDRGRVISTSSRLVTELVSLELSNGSRITCTPSHRIFTDRGWVEAAAVEFGSLTYSPEGMRTLRESVSPLEDSKGQRPIQHLQGKTLEQANVLLSILCQEIQQPDEQESGAPENEGEIERDSPQAYQTRRQRAVIAIGSTGYPSRAGRGMGVGSCSCDRNRSSERIPDLLQDRRGEQGTKTRIRVGRSEPCHSRAEGTRRQENGFLEECRVVRVSRIKCESATPVFNLHVSGHPSYFANGILVHNCHLIPPEGEGRYRTFLDDAKVVNPLVRVGGFTATPYRTDTGMLCGPDKILNRVCYEVGMHQLMQDGFLCQVRSKRTRNAIDLSDLHVRAGEFISAEMEVLFSADEVLRPAVAEILTITADRQSVLIFAAGVQHAWKVAGEIERQGHRCLVVTGETSSDERSDILEEFKERRLKYLVNVNVLTTGFDATCIDCVVLLRATLSPGLYYQICGRGFRLHPGKSTCLILDYGANISRHGPVDRIRVKGQKGDGPVPTRFCPECEEAIPLGAAVCPCCGYEMPREEPDKKHADTASEKEVIAGPAPSAKECHWLPVESVDYMAHRKRGADDTAPRTLRVVYRVGWEQSHSEWVCFEHTGFPRGKAVVWWVNRSKVRCPRSVDEALFYADAGCLAVPVEVQVEKKPDDKWWTITGVKLGDIPEAPEGIQQRYAERLANDEFAPVLADPVDADEWLVEPNQRTVNLDADDDKDWTDEWSVDQWKTDEHIPF